MASKPKQPASTDKLDAFLRANQAGHIPVDLPPKAIEELRYLEGEAKKGRRMSNKALQRWIKEAHGVEIGITRLHTIATENGITPWFRPRS